MLENTYFIYIKKLLNPLGFSQGLLHLIFNKVVINSYFKAVIIFYI